MKIKKALLRYYPPGIILQCERKDGSIVNKTLDLLDLNPSTDVDYLSEQAFYQYTFLPPKFKPTLIKLIESNILIRANC